MHRSRSIVRRIVAVSAVASLVASAGCTRYGGSLGRSEEAVVLAGSALPLLVGAAPSRIVGFAWDGTNWHQVPVQVDERDLVNPGQILHWPTGSWPKKYDQTPFTALVYTAPTSMTAGYQYWDTYTPPDSNPLVDANDEIVFLADDTGVQAPGGSAPPAVATATRSEVKVTDPLVANSFGYLYLFTSTTLTGGGAGTTGVVYNFSLDAGSYLNNYKMGTAALAPNNVAAPNPEHSSITTPTYSQTYGDRWLNNGLVVTAGGASGAGLLERTRVQFLPGFCIRSEDTFDYTLVAAPYVGAFIVNISGPVRAIRSHIGANSGTYTVATHLFYPQREDTVIELRVHAIPSVMLFDDMLTSTTGLSYSDDQNTAVPIDGVPDTITAAHAATWQMVSGAAGSVVTSSAMVTTIPGMQVSTYHLDQRPASPTPCTGDTAAWGQNGLMVKGNGGGSIPCTDPTSCPAASLYSLVTTRHRNFASADLPATSAAALAAHAATPLQTTVT